MHFQHACNSVSIKTVGCKQYLARFACGIQIVWLRQLETETHDTMLATTDNTLV